MYLQIHHIQYTTSLVPQRSRVVRAESVSIIVRALLSLQSVNFQNYEEDKEEACGTLIHIRERERAEALESLRHNQ
jgi:hypothetical protein